MFKKNEDQAKCATQAAKYLAKLFRDFSDKYFADDNLKQSFLNQQQINKRKIRKLKGGSKAVYLYINKLYIYI